MNSIISLIDQYDAVLRKYNLPNYNKLYAPESGQQVTEYFDLLKLNDEALRALYAWKNGFDPDDHEHLTCQLSLFGAFLPLSGIRETNKIRMEEEIWGAQFITLITEGMGEYILFNNEKGGDYGKLYLYSVSSLIIEPESYYDSLTAMLETDISAYENGVFHYDPRM